LNALFQLLAHPAEYRTLRDMPDFQLEEMEAANLAAHLATWKAGEVEKSGAAGAEPDPAELIAAGRRLFAARGCSSCHAAPGFEAEGAKKNAPGLAGRSLSGLQRGCLSKEDDRPEVPRFDLAAGDLQALSIYYESLPPAPAALAAQERAARAWRDEQRCLNCHERDGEGGEALRRAAPRAGAAGPAPAVNLPPDLSGAGARLKPLWIQAVLAGQAPRARPWLGWRMPRFAFQEPQIQEIAAALLAADAGLPRENSQPPSARENASTSPP
jgi:cytochrome c553